MNEPVDFTGKKKAFSALLDAVLIEEVSTQAYVQKYLRHLLQHKTYYLDIYADVLEKVQQQLSLPATAITLVDFGAGNGLLGLFAKFYGFGKLYLNDLDQSFVESASRLALQLNIRVEGFIVGDIAAVKEYLTGKPVNAVAGTDVIEHVYNLQEFFTTIQEINPAMVTVFTTASNPHNFLKVKRLKKLQVRDEFVGGTPGDFDLFGSEAHSSFLNMRKQVIQKLLPGGTTAIIDQLAQATRGLNEKDIFRAVATYKEKGVFPMPLSHPTNTCNPATGSWTERILTLADYKKIYRAAGFSLQVHNGFYDEHKKGLKKVIYKLLNNSVRILGKIISPYIVLVGRKN